MIATHTCARAHTHTHTHKILPGLFNRPITLLFSLAWKNKSLVNSFRPGVFKKRGKAVFLDSVLDHLTVDITCFSLGIWQPSEQPVICQPVWRQTGGPPLLAEMFNKDQVKLLVTERLSAAAEEIFSIFEQTVKEYEETVIRLKQEIEEQRRLAGWKGNGMQGLL